MQGAVYKIVSFRTGVGAESLNLKKKARNWLNYSLNDPIVKTLSKNSNLTKIQLETLLIDVLAENISDRGLKYDEKAKLRIFAVSRGAFNRSLRQARQNVTQSIYTILLLGYLGILEEISLEPYLEAANKLKTYINTHNDIIYNSFCPVILLAQSHYSAIIKKQYRNCAKQQNRRHY